jgi:hypothetical protein
VFQRLPDRQIIGLCDRRKFTTAQCKLRERNTPDSTSDIRYTLQYYGFKSIEPASGFGKLGDPASTTDVYPRPSMAKKAAPKPGETEAARDPTLTISKAEAVRQALAAGMDSPTDGTGFLKSTYGIEMTSQMWSSYKAQQKARDAKQADKPKAKRGRPRVAQLDQIVKTIQPAVGKSVIADLAAVKALVERLGIDEVIGIAKLFG